MGAATGAMLPFRSNLSLAAAALVFVLPVVGAMLVGGARVGLLGVVLGFLVLDLLFIPPYGTLAVGSGQNWLALVAYVAVVLLVATVVSRLQQLRADSARRVADSRRLLELSELLVADKPVKDMLAVVASSVRNAFNLETVALLLPSVGTGYLEIVASDGLELGAESLDRLLPSSGSPASLTGSIVAGALLRQIPLTAAGRPVGLLVLRGRALDVHDRGLLATYANHAALAIERAQLRDQALQANLLQKVDEWRAALVSAVAHDLRTPLASIKVAVSDLREPAIVLPETARRDLLETIEEQTDRLTRLVSTVLDLWRLEAGALKPKTRASRSGGPHRRSRCARRKLARHLETAKGRGTSPTPARSGPHADRPSTGKPAGERRQAQPAGCRDPGRGDTTDRIGGRGRDRGLRLGPGSPAGPARGDLRTVPPRSRWRACRPRAGHCEGVRRGARWPYRSRNRTGRRSARFMLTAPAASFFTCGLPADDEVSL